MSIAVARYFYRWCNRWGCYHRNSYHRWTATQRCIYLITDIVSYRMCTRWRTTWDNYQACLCIYIRFVGRWRARVYRYTRYRCRYTTYLVIRQYIAGSSVSSTAYRMGIVVTRYFYRWCNRWGCYTLHYYRSSSN